ncbi:MAG: penicillin-binding protein 1A [Pseudomonadota bacterium]
MRTFLKLSLALFCTGCLVAIVGAIGVWAYFAPQLPTTDEISRIELHQPMQVLSQDGDLIAEYGLKRRMPVDINDVPEQVRQAFVSAEDDRFYEHPGVDWQGLLRAVYVVATTGEKSQGGSTITMQVARNLFLDNSKRYSRKVKEILLALRLERELDKPRILELYLNSIFFGNRAWGVASAAQIYYDKTLDELTLPEAAMIAGLPKAPSAYNPIANPERATQRRNYVLRRMHELGVIDRDAFESARVAGLTAGLHFAKQELDAGYVAEMVRSTLHAQHGDAIYNDGWKVYTTVSSRLQSAANRGLRDALHSYEERHGYRGPVQTLDPETVADADAVAEALDGVRVFGDLHAAVVTRVDATSADVTLDSGARNVLDLDGVQWARAFEAVNTVGPEVETVDQVLGLGDVVYVRTTDDGRLRLAQLPGPEGALVALDPRNGRVLALVGGYAFDRSKFNRVNQAARQPGSNFKPFIYSAGLENGLTLASVFNDAPVVFADDKLEDVWRPENYSGRVYGPTRLREALVKSRNLVSIRVLRKIGVPYAVDYVRRFGFEDESLPRDLSLSLGSGVVKPIDLVSGYAVFANGGYRVEPWFIERIENNKGDVIFEADPVVACEGEDCIVSTLRQTDDGRYVSELRSHRVAPKVLEPDVAWLMDSVLGDVVTRGTATLARRELGRGDLAGKTGTTNEQMDAWFTGYHPSVVATAWVGFDQVQTLGAKETGGRAALPMWINFMREALDGVPEQAKEQPDSIVRVRIDRETGRLASAGGRDTVFELFRDETATQVAEQGNGSVGDAGEEAGDGEAVASQSPLWAEVPSESADSDVREQLF